MHAANNNAQFPLMGLCHRSTLGGWTIEPPPNASPLLVFINTKSGGNHGVVLMRMFKGLLNPVQVFDLHKNGYVQARDNSVNPPLILLVFVSCH